MSDVSVKRQPWILLGVLMAVHPFLFELAAQDLSSPPPARSIVETDQKGFPSSRLQWGRVEAGLLEASGCLRVFPPTPFTSIAVAWTVEGGEPPACRFSFAVRSRTRGGVWSSRVIVEGDVSPGENPSGLYWSNLYMTPGGISNEEVEITPAIPHSVRLTSFQVMASELLRGFPTHASAREGTAHAAQPTGFSRPAIIPRSGWWGNLPPDSLDAHFGPIRITITHSVVHHTAMTNNPPDPAQEIRSIWNLHVYGNGWSDIGYNFLIDQYGNIYQGRYNPWLDSTDVQGAHATSANVKSVGISILGNFGTAAGGIPEARALRALESLIAWRFDQRQLNPMEEASIPTNLGGPRVVPRVCGHRDVGTTECPGQNLYVLLPEVRSNVRTLITASAVHENEPPGVFALAQNFPNPFNPATVIRYQVPAASGVRVSVCDLLGREVSVLVNERKEAGVHEVKFDASGLSSGVYLYRVQAGAFVQSRRMLLLK